MSIRNTACLVALGILGCCIGCENIAWRDAVARNSIPAYDLFLHEFPESGFAPEARQRLDTLCFEQAEKEGTTEAFEGFLRRFPKSKFAPEAKEKAESMRFERAWAAGTAEALEDFLRYHPNSKFAPEARENAETLRFEHASAKGTLEAMEDFLRRFPGSRFAPDARQKTEGLRYERATATATIEAFETYLKEYPTASFTAEARKSLERLRQEIRQMEEAARRVLPQGAEVKVTTVSRYPERPEFVIAAHLLEGHSADESSPYVVGDYGTHEKLTRLVQFRCAKIVKSVARGAMPSEGSVLVIHTRHGVRQRQGGQPFEAGTDVATTIYVVAIPLTKMGENDVGKLNEESVMKLWDVRKNIIPSLEFHSQ